MFVIFLYHSHFIRYFVYTYHLTTYELTYVCLQRNEKEDNILLKFALSILYQVHLMKIFVFQVLLTRHETEIY